MANDQPGRRSLAVLDAVVAGATTVAQVSEATGIEALYVNRALRLLEHKHGVLSTSRKFLHWRYLPDGRSQAVHGSVIRPNFKKIEEMRQQWQ